MEGFRGFFGDRPAKESMKPLGKRAPSGQAGFDPHVTI